MDRHRAYLRNLAMELGDEWAQGASPPAMRARLRVETRNTIYEMNDGACASVTRRQDGKRSDPADIIGMRLLGFLMPDDPYAGLQLVWRPGAYAVLWRPGRGGEATAQVALTSATTAVATVHRVLPPAPKRMSIPPPLPAIATPSGMRRVSTPPPLPAAASIARVQVPRPPPTPTPATTPRAMPPSPPRRVTTSSGSYASA
jgi:hypothetical protein